MILIKGSRVLDPAGKTDSRADLVIEDGIIREICPPDTLEEEQKRNMNR